MLWLYPLLVLAVFAQCPASLLPVDIESMRLLATTGNSGEFLIRASSNSFYYNQTLQNIYNKTPSVAVGIHQLEGTSSSEVSLSMRSLVSSSAGGTVQFLLTLGAKSQWTAIRFSCLCTSRQDFELGQFLADTTSFLYSSVTSLQVATPLPAPPSAAITNILISGVRMFAISGNLDVAVGSSSANSTHILVNLLKSTDCFVDVIWLSYVRVQLQSLQVDLRILTGSYVVSVNGVTNSINQDTTFYSLGANMLGFTSLNFTSQAVPLGISVNILDNFTLKSTITASSSKFTVWYVLVEPLPKSFCKYCIGGSNFEAGLCVASCTYNSIVVSSPLGYNYCVRCNTQSLQVANKNQSECICTQQFYKTSTGQCLPCDYTCITCQNSVSCLTCDTVPPIGTHRVLLNGKCVCVAQRFYDNIDTQDPVCSPCPYSCLSCQNSQICTSCSTESGRVLTNGKCLCTSGFVDDGGSEICASAGNGSIRFMSTIPAQGTCQPNQQFIGGSCQCRPPFYTIAGACQKCEPSKFFNGTYCITCFNGVVSDNGAACICNNGYYFVQGSCQQPSLNQYFNGVTFVCTVGTFNVSGSCMRAGPNQVFDGTKFVCANGYYLINNLCAVCPAGSVFNGVNCVASSCPPNSNIQGSTCVCNPGYLTFKTSTGIVCQACPPNSQPNPSLSGCMCNPSYFVDFSTSDPKCAPCDASCATCSGFASNQCLSCSNLNSVLTNGACVANRCPPSYFFNATAPLPYVCFPCPDYCSLCIDQSTCSRCSDGYTLNSRMGCSEICGDGRRFPTSQCDDGNAVSGDGCSSTCSVQPGWTCTGGSQIGKDLCQRATFTAGVTRVVLTQRETKRIGAIVGTAIELNYIPQSLSSDGCSLCSNLLAVQLVQAEFIPTVKISFQNTQPYVYAVIFSFTSESNMGQFTFTVSLNHQFDVYYSGVDTSQILRITINPLSLPSS